MRGIRMTNRNDARMEQRDGHVDSSECAQQHSIMAEIATGRMSDKEDEKRIGWNGEKSKRVEQHLYSLPFCQSALLINIKKQQKKL